MKLVKTSLVALLVASPALATDYSVEGIADKFKEYGVELTQTQVDSIVSNSVDINGDYEAYLKASDAVSGCANLAACQSAMTSLTTAQSTWKAHGNTTSVLDDLDNLKTVFDGIISDSVDEKQSDINDYLGDWATGVGNVVSYDVDVKIGKEDDAEKAKAGYALIKAAIGVSDDNYTASVTNKVDGEEAQTVDDFIETFGLSTSDDFATDTTWDDGFFDDEDGWNATAFEHSAHNTLFVYAVKGDDNEYSLSATTELLGYFDNNTTDEIKLVDLTSTYGSSGSYLYATVTDEDDNDTHYTLSSFK